MRTDMLILAGVGGALVLLVIGFALGHAVRGWRCICKDSEQPIYVTPGANLEPQPERARHRHRDLDEPTSQLTRRRLAPNWRSEVDTRDHA